MRKAHFDNARFNGDFGNGRYARNIIEKAKMAQASRLISGDLSTVTKEDIQTIIAEDFTFTEDSKVTAKMKMGFCQD